MYLKRAFVEHFSPTFTFTSVMISVVMSEGLSFRGFLLNGQTYTSFIDFDVYSRSELAGLLEYKHTLALRKLSSKV